MGSGLFDSGLAFNSDLVRFTFEIMEIEEWRKRDLFRMVMVYAEEYKSYAIEKQKKEAQRG